MRRFLRTIAAMVAAIVLAGCGSGCGEPVIYQTSIVNDSDSVFVMSPGYDIFVVPPHSLLRSALGDAADPYVLTLYGTDCTRLGQVELSQEKPQAYIDAGGHLSLRTAAEASAAPKPEFEIATAAGDLSGTSMSLPAGGSTSETTVRTTSWSASGTSRLCGIGSEPTPGPPSLVIQA